MTGVAVVASAHDAKFAEEVRAALQAAGLDASVSQSLPKAPGPHVVLIWSAALEAGHAIDAQALIGLWSEDRLVIAPRDGTPLPLGLRDLPALAPTASVQDILSAVLSAPVSGRLGRYDLTAVLGKGAMGIVYEAMDPKLHRKVAIRTFLKSQMEGGEGFSERFLRAAAAVARLNHPHIVQVYDFGEEGDVAYVVTEFIKGKELKNFFDSNERFELKEAVRIMCELLDALDFAHESGIVHRALRPGCVILDAQARVKLADFSLARVPDHRSKVEKSQPGAMVGTSAIMSPEQITGGSVDRRSDIFSAGMILYQLLTGEKPFSGAGAWSVAKKVVQDHPPVPSSINNAISPLFDNVVNKALSKTVEGRYQMAKEFAVALKRALEGKSDENESDKTVVGSMSDSPMYSRVAAMGAGAKVGATGRTGSTNRQEVELEFWQAIKDGNDPDDFELYVQQFPTGIYVALAKRKIAKLKGVAPEESSAEAKAKEKKEADAKRKLVDTPKAKMPIGVVAGVIIAIAAAGGGAWYYFNKSNLEKQAALTAALETAAKASQDSASAAKHAAKSAATAKAEAPAKMEVAVAAPAAESPKAEAPASKAPEPEVAKSAPLPMSRSERARSGDEEAARKALEAAGKTPSAAPQAPVQVASAALSEPTSTDRARSSPEHGALYQQALAMEQDGNAKDAIRIYRRAARAGSGKAAIRLGQIYERGIPGVSRDYAESLQWYETARQLGEIVGTAGRGGSGPAVVPSPARTAPEVTAKPAPPPKPEEPVAAFEPKLEPKSAPPPAPAAIPEPPKAAAPTPSPAPEPKSGWFSWRGLLIALFVLALIAWRRSRRREKAEARQAQRASAAAVDHKDATAMAKPSFSRGRRVAAQQTPPAGDATLFVSYSHKDRSRVEPIVSVIEDMGRRVWMDRTDITGQTGWAGQIVRAIRECRAVVLMASPNSYNSDQVVRELYLAMNHRKTIVPIEIEPAEMPDELQYILAPFQHHRLSAGETRTVLGRALAAV